MSKTIQAGLQPDAMNWSMMRSFLIDLSRSGRFTNGNEARISFDSCSRSSCSKSFFIASAPITILALVDSVLS